MPKIMISQATPDAEIRLVRIVGLLECGEHFGEGGGIGAYFFGSVPGMEI